MNTQTSLGYAHVVYDLYGCSKQLLTNSVSTVKGLVEACRKAELKVVEQSIHVYPNSAFSVSIFLSESHVSLHTWPENAYCALDIFLCSGDMQRAEFSLLDFLRPKAQFRISLNRGTENPIPIGQWTMARGLPGYHEAYQTRQTLYKQSSSFQLIEMIESEKFGKILLLDKDVQLSTSDEHIYHELLVHPAMRTHIDPQRVLIIGGGDGGTLREVLKYSAVKRAVLVDIDPEVVQRCRELIPEISRGSFDDPRVELINVDAAEFQTSETFDVIIVDLTAPHGVSLPAYRKLALNIRSFLSREGILAMHSGWWWSRSDMDYPTLLLDGFNYAILKNQWIPSFACFWSFLFAWKHDMEPSTALTRIDEKNGDVETLYFEGKDFSRTAFVRCPMKSYSNNLL